MPHAFPAQVFAAYIALPEAVPQDLIVPEVSLVKRFEIRDPHLRQLEFIEKLRQAFLSVGIKIPKCMIQIKKQMLVLHD